MFFLQVMGTRGRRLVYSVLLLSYTCCVSFLSENEQPFTVITWFKEPIRIFWKVNTSVRLQMLNRAKANSLFNEAEKP